MTKSISTRVTAAIGALALGILGAVAVSAPASAAPGPNLTPGDTGTITVHKHKQPLVSGAPATGADQGILTESGGTINIFTHNSVVVGTSRIFTLRGGDERRVVASIVNRNPQRERMLELTLANCQLSPVSTRLLMAKGLGPDAGMLERTGQMRPPDGKPISLMIPPYAVLLLQAQCN